MRALYDRLAAWVEHFFGPAPQQAMVACRIAFGLLLFVSYLTKAPWLETLFGPAGMGGYALAARVPEAAFGRPIDSPFHWLAASDSWMLVQAAWILLLLCSLSFAAGYRTRTTGAIALLLHAAFVSRNQYAFYGWAWMAKPFILYVVLAPSGRWVSVDAWRSHRRSPSSRPSPSWRPSPSSRPSADWMGSGWPLRLLKLHVCAMYAVTGLARLEDSGWLRGEMVFSAVTDRRFGRLDLDWHPYVALLEPMSYVALIAEPLAPILLWIPGLGTAWAVVLMGMHLGLELLANVGWWQLLMMSALMVFLPVRWLERPLARLDGWGRRLFRAPAGFPL